MNEINRARSRHSPWQMTRAQAHRPRRPSLVWHTDSIKRGALKPLVSPLVLRDLNFGYGELGIMLGVASAVGGLLQLGAGALGRILPRHQILGIGNASVGVCSVFVGLAQSYFQFVFWTIMSRVGGAAQHPVGASLLSQHYNKRKLGTALATHFTAGNVGKAVIPLCAAILISLWDWRGTVILFAVPAILVGVACPSGLEILPSNKRPHQSLYLFLAGQ